MIDDAAVFNMLKLGASQSFDEYSDTIFCPFINKQLDSVQRFDIVWDTCIDKRYRNATRRKQEAKITIKT